MTRSHHKPLFFTDREFQAFEGAPDPADVTAIAHESAAILVGAGRTNADPEVTARLIALTDEIGLSTLAQLWAGRPAVSLPGVLFIGAAVCLPLFHAAHRLRHGLFDLSLGQDTRNKWLMYGLAALLSLLALALVVVGWLR